MSRPAQLDQFIAEVLAEAGLEHVHSGPGSFIITLPGSKKLQTVCRLVVGHHGVLVEAFVCRRPDEAHEDVYRWLLRRNARLYGVHYALDARGDIYLIGRLAHHSVTAEELDRVLGQVFEAADGDFNTLLEIGFASSIRREWAWRVARGESLHNLAAFEHLVR
ncbi:MAG TPA: YbjN domain-containing protein [Pseudonocardiaceae bacterium]|nr:YbjN domain-containing protein [Pseudonocardiaceae bacterium]